MYKAELSELGRYKSETASQKSNKVKKRIDNSSHADIDKEINAPKVPFYTIRVGVIRGTMSSYGLAFRSNSE